MSTAAPTAAPVALEPDDVVLPEGARAIDNEPDTSAPPPTEAPTTSNGNGKHARLVAAWHDHEAELHLAANLMVGREHIAAALEIVQPDDLSPRGAGLLLAIVDLDATGERFDAGTIARHRAVDNLELAKALDTHVTGTWRPYAVHLAELAHRRRIYHAAEELQQAARTGDEERIERWRGVLAAVTGLVAFTSWGEIDLGPVLDGEELTQPPELLLRSDGQPLLYRGKVHAFNAESESGKSWLALYACVERLEVGEHVIYIDFEDGAAGVTERMVDLGAPLDLLSGPDRLFHYVRPDDPIETSAITRLVGLHAALVVVDGVTEVMVQNGWSVKENDDVALLLAALARPFARDGSAVVLIDHVVKDKAARGDDALGGGHKRAGIDGATYKLETIRQFGRGMAGAARLTITKDRPGHIRPACVAGKTVGELRLTSTADGATLTVVAPEQIINPDAAFRPTTLMERVSMAVEEANAAGSKPSGNELLKTIKGNRNAAAKALAALIGEGYVELELGPRGAKLHVSAKPYRTAKDPSSDRYVADEEQAYEDAPVLWDPGDGEPF